MTKRAWFSALMKRFSSKDGSSGMPPMPVAPPVDLDTPVTNPGLVAAIGKHQQLQSRQSADELIDELRTAVFLVAILLEKPLMKTSPSQALFRKGDTIGIVQVLDDSDNRLLALFTDHAELQRFTDRATSALVMPSKDAMAFVLERGYAGLVVNPAAQATLRLDTAFIRAIAESL